MTRYTIIKVLILFAGVLLLLPPIIRLKEYADHKSQQEKETDVNFSAAEFPLDAAQRNAITLTTWPGLPESFRNEKPRKTLLEVPPVRWNSKFDPAQNADLWRKFQSHTADITITGPASLIDVWENVGPIPGIGLVVAPLGKTERGAKCNPWRVVIYLKITDEGFRTQILQAWADGTLDLKYDLASFLAVPLFIDDTHKVIHAMATAPMHAGLIVNESWDWAFESEKVKTDFADRLRRARAAEEIEAIQAQIKAKREEGYDL